MFSVACDFPKHDNCNRSTHEDYAQDSEIYSADETGFCRPVIVFKNEIC
jgi:hypothetical protein